MSCRANAQQPKLFVGMILILIFAEALALYGLIGESCNQKLCVMHIVLASHTCANTGSVLPQNASNFDGLFAACCFVLNGGESHHLISLSTAFLCCCLEGASCANVLQNV